MKTYHFAMGIVQVAAWSANGVLAEMTLPSGITLATIWFSFTASVFTTWQCYTFVTCITGPTIFTCAGIRISAGSVNTVFGTFGCKTDIKITTFHESEDSTYGCRNVFQYTCPWSACLCLSCNCTQMQCCILHERIQAKKYIVHKYFRP